jgi:hypothetical protein
MLKHFMVSLLRGFRGRSTKITTVLQALALAVAGVLAGAAAHAQMAGMSSMPPRVEVVFVCPFDRSIRGVTPGMCARRGRRVDLVAEVPEPLEFPLDLATTPRDLVPGRSARLRFQVRDPWVNQIVTKFTVVHESPFHAFVVSEDLEFFLHDHPRWNGRAFELDAVLPKPGLYRVLADFLPEAATPQSLREAFMPAVARPRHLP